MFSMGRIALGVVASAVAVISVAAPAQADRGPDGHYYGAIAISTDNPEDATVGYITARYPSQAAADRAALEGCGYSNCWIIVRYVDGCGALAERDGRYLGGVGATQAEAERAAIAAFGPTPPPSLSSESTPARVVDSQCN